MHECVYAAHATTWLDRSKCEHKQHTSHTWSCVGSSQLCVMWMLLCRAVAHKTAVMTRGKKLAAANAQHYRSCDMLTAVADV